MVLCLGSVFSMTAMAQAPVQDPAKMWTRSPYPLQLKDTPEIKAEMDIARQLAGDDWYFLQLQRLQCNDIDDTYTVVGPPGVNITWKEVPAVPTKVFDNVYYVGGMEVGGWVIDTGKGYIMLDASYDYGYEEILLPNMKKLGLDPAKIKYILVTHAGPDHVGCAYKFQRDYPGIQVIYNNTIKPNPAYLPYPPVVTSIRYPPGSTTSIAVNRSPLRKFMPATPPAVRPIARICFSDMRRA